MNCFTFLCILRKKVFHKLVEPLLLSREPTHLLPFSFARFAPFAPFADSLVFNAWIQHFADLLFSPSLPSSLSNNGLKSIFDFQNHNGYARLCKRQKTDALLGHWLKRTDHSLLIIFCWSLADRSCFTQKGMSEAEMTLQLLINFVLFFHFPFLRYSNTFSIAFICTFVYHFTSTFTCTSKEETIFLSDP